MPREHISSPPPLSQGSGTATHSTSWIADNGVFPVDDESASHRQVSSHEAFLKLDKLARHWFIMGLNNWDVEEPVQQTFPLMSTSHTIFSDAVQKVHDLYKTWKN